MLGSKMERKVSNNSVRSAEVIHLSQVKADKWAEASTLTPLTL